MAAATTIGVLSSTSLHSGTRFLNNCSSISHLYCSSFLPNFHLPHFPSTVTHIQSAEFHRWSVLLHRRQGWVLHSSRRKLESLLLFHCPPLQFPRQVNNLVPWYSCTCKIVWFVISWLFKLKCVTEWGFFAALEFQPSIFLALFVLVLVYRLHPRSHLEFHWWLVRSLAILLKPITVLVLFPFKITRLYIMKIEMLMVHR